MAVANDRATCCPEILCGHDHASWHSHLIQALVAAARLSSISTGTAPTRAFERGLVWKHLDLDGAALQFLLHAALHRIGDAHAAAMVPGQREDRETLGCALLQPCGEFRGGVAVIRGQFGQGSFGLGPRTGGPDVSQFSADALSADDVRRVMDGVAGEVELTPLPRRGAKDRPARRPRSSDCG